MALHLASAALVALQVAGPRSAGAEPPQALPSPPAAPAADLREVLGLVPLRPVPEGRRAPMVAIVGSPAPGMYELEIQNTGSGFAETFLLQLPPHPSKADPSPLLVAFHKFGSSPYDIPVNTDFEDACHARNWFLVAPLGAAQSNFSSLPSQHNIELVLRMLVNRLGPWIDRERIYGLGFSMGGLSALNFAARHLDPETPMFAALVDHTGTAALHDTYYGEPSTQAVLEFWFGGSPVARPFEYARSSVLDAQQVVTAAMVIGPGGGTGGGTGGGGIPGDPPVVLAVNEESSLAWNLTHVPIYAVRGKFDPKAHLKAQLEALVDFLRDNGGAVEHVSVPNVFTHAWSTLDEETALDWLAQHRLELPSAAHTLADRDGRWFSFLVEQDAPGAFTPFTWSVDGAANRVSVEETANLARIGVLLAEAGLDAERVLTVAHSAADGSADVVRLLGFERAPRSVLRDGLATTSFAWDAQSGVLALFESDAQSHVWTVVPAAAR